LLIICLFNLIPAFNQSTSLCLKDKITGQPVEFARVIVKSIKESEEKSMLSNDKGEFEINMMLPAYIIVTSLGYKMYSDTITNAGKHILLLTPDYYHLDNIVVTGQFRPQVADKSIYQIKVIDNKQTRFKTATNLDELLKNELGFQYLNEGALGNMMRIHGLTGEYIKVLIDGMPVTGREEGFIDLGQIGLYNVDHVEIVEGPMSIVYGSNALAGAINIISSDYSDYELLARINAHYETAGIYNFDGVFARHFQNHSVSLNVARNFFSGWSPFDSSRTQLLKPKLQYIAGTTYHYNKNRFKLSFTCDFINEELRDLGPLSYDGKALDVYFFTTRLNNSLNLTNVYSKNFVVNLQAGYSFYRRKEITYQNDLVNLVKTKAANPELQDTSTFQSISSRGFVSNTPGKKIEYQTGFEYSYEFVNGKRLQGTQSITDVAGFVNLIYHPVPLLSFQPGIRFIYNSKYSAPVVYAFNVKYNPGAFTFRGSYAKGFSAPSLKQLYLQFIDSNHEIYGNKNLTSETANNFSISGNYTYTRVKHSFALDINLFYNSIQNAIQLAIDTTRPGWGMYFNVNGNEYKTKGVESTLTYNLAPNITFNAGITTTGTSRLDGQNSFFYSTDFVSSAAYHNLKYKYELSLLYKYTGKSMDFTGSFDASRQLIGIAQRSVNSYNTMDLTLSKSLFKDRMTLSAGVKNLFDVTLVDKQGNINFHAGSGNSVATGYGRSYFIQLSFQFDKF
jgi:outer membrane receptor for ferrienterochelin and colicins